MTFGDASTMTDEDLYTLLDFKPVEDDTISPERKKVMHERYTMIAPVLSFIRDENTRSHVINIIAAENNISKQSIRSFLKKYMVIQNIQVLLPKEREYDTALTKDQKNIRWSLNKFFYTCMVSILMKQHGLLINCLDGSYQIKGVNISAIPLNRLLSWE
ncbi:MAG: hypothetical protein K6A69_06955 [Lachnospiraceae bacterium]|nr:hypothetical protein [Lachnospiraceae bacterium]